MLAAATASGSAVSGATRCAAGWLTAFVAFVAFAAVVAAISSTTLAVAIKRVNMLLFPRKCAAAGMRDRSKLDTDRRTLTSTARKSGPAAVR
ncbi:MAG TPA: hypothetical protein VFE77_12070 [Rhodanobacter sp.]|nr:hypothetical protein [Rhodanobacter sp.]